MKTRFAKLSLGVGAAVLFATTPLRAETLNLLCHYNPDPRVTSVPGSYLAVWINFEEKTATSAGYAKGQIDNATIKTTPVEITAGSFHYVLDAWDITINRMTGNAVQIFTPARNNPPISVSCEKGTLPLPAGKF